METLILIIGILIGISLAPRSNVSRRGGYQPGQSTKLPYGPLPTDWKDILPDLHPPSGCSNINKSG